MDFSELLGNSDLKNSARGNLWRCSISSNGTRSPRCNFTHGTRIILMTIILHLCVSLHSRGWSALLMNRGVCLVEVYWHSLFIAYTVIV